MTTRELIKELEYWLSISGEDDVELVVEDEYGFLEILEIGPGCLDEDGKAIAIKILVE